MKTVIFILMLVFIGCSDDAENINMWIKKHKKPIVCRYSYTDGITLKKKYTLISLPTQEVYLTGYTRLSLPDTIR